MSQDDGSVQPALLNAFLLTTKDALMVFEASRRGICPVVTRRLHDSEKASMITSGSVFAFDEKATGIKRWTDGALWSPSRIIGNYLVYRELEKKGETEADKTTAPSSSLPSPHDFGPTQPQHADPFETFSKEVPSLKTEGSSSGRPGSSTSATPVSSGSTGLQRDLERALVGSLTSSYRFKKGGLVKKTISNGHMHLICYYTIEDVIAGRLRSPSSLNELASLEISPGFLNPKHFRIPPLLEYDAAGNVRYVGEEHDPVGMPSTLPPLLSHQYTAPPQPPGLSMSTLRRDSGSTISPGYAPSLAYHSSMQPPANQYYSSYVDSTAYQQPIRNQPPTDYQPLSGSSLHLHDPYPPNVGYDHYGAPSTWPGDRHFYPSADGQSAHPRSSTGVPAYAEPALPSPPSHITPLPMHQQRRPPSSSVIQQPFPRRPSHSSLSSHEHHSESRVRRPSDMTAFVPVSGHYPSHPYEETVSSTGRHYVKSEVQSPYSADTSLPSQSQYIEYRHEEPPSYTGQVLMPQSKQVSHPVSGSGYSGVQDHEPIPLSSNYFTSPYSQSQRSLSGPAPQLSHRAQSHQVELGQSQFRSSQYRASDPYPLPQGGRYSRPQNPASQQHLQQSQSQPHQSQQPSQPQQPQ